MTEEAGPPNTLSREDLYELVWSKPVRELALDFGISDVALAKRCRRLGIPIPGRGYWARVDAGQQPYRPKLPQRAPQWSDQGALTVAPSENATPQGPPPSTEDQVWLQEKLAAEKLNEASIAVPSTTRKWHPAIQEYREQLDQAAEELRASRKADERYQKRPEWRKRVESDGDAWKWRWVKDRGQRLCDTHKPAAFRVSLDSYKRALSIVNALAIAAENRGFAVQKDEKIGRVVFSGHQADIHLRVTEILQEKSRSRIRYDGKSEQEAYQVPTGRLRMTLAIGYREGPSFEDGDSNKLESQLNRLFEGMYRLVLKVWQQDRKHLEFWRNMEEEDRRRAEAGRLRAEQERAVAEERARRKSLSSEASKWAESLRIRRYVHHIRATASERGVPEDSLKKWIEWALIVASELDPSEERIAVRRDDISDQAR